MRSHLSTKSFLWSNYAQKITSLFPATTTNCTTTLTTATTPAQHGWFAWALHIDGKTVELYRDKEYYTSETLPNGYASKKLPITSFWELQGLRKDITCYSLFNEKIKRTSGQNISFTDLQDMILKLNGLLQQQDKKFVYAYYSDLDNKMHDYGVASRKTKKLVRMIDKAIEKLINDNADTLLIITADHSQFDVKDFVNIYADKEILKCLAKPFACDPRATAFYIKKRNARAIQKGFSKIRE